MALMRSPLAALLCLALLACADEDPPILSLDGEAVRRSEFERHLASLESRTALGPLTVEVRRGLLDSFLEERALVIEARHRGLLAAGADAETEAQAVARLLAAVVPEPTVTVPEVAAWYEAHRSELAVPEKVGLRQVLVGTLNEARDVKRRLAHDAREFDTLARSLSKGPEAAMGGYMGAFERGQLPPELEEAAFSLAEGATSEPVASPLGYHVLKVESRQVARDVPLEEARERIRARLAREKRETAERAFVAQLLARAKVNHEAALASRR